MPDLSIHANARSKARCISEIAIELITLFSVPCRRRNANSYRLDDWDLAELAEIIGPKHFRRHAYGLQGYVIEADDERVITVAHPRR